MGISSKKLTQLKNIRKAFFSFFQEKKVSLFSSLFHADLKFFVSENIILNYSDYELFCKKFFTDQLQLKFDLIEEAVIEENKFRLVIFATLIHQNYEKLEFPISVIMVIKEGKVAAFKTESSFDWTMVEYLMEPLADVLNGFEILS